MKTVMVNACLHVPGLLAVPGIPRTHPGRSGSGGTLRATSRVSPPLPSQATGDTASATAPGTRVAGSSLHQQAFNHATNGPGPPTAARAEDDALGLRTCGSQLGRGPDRQRRASAEDLGDTGSDAAWLASQAQAPSAASHHPRAFSMIGPARHHRTVGSRRGGPA
jgi:hypothetical protein